MKLTLENLLLKLKLEFFFLLETYWDTSYDRYKNIIQSFLASLKNFFFVSSS